MPRFIILTKHQAAAIRGGTGEGAALDPVPLKDGVTFVLPEVVLSDPDHAFRHKGLSSKPVREIAPGEWAEPEEEGP